MFVLRSWYRAPLININICPTRCNTKQSIHYSECSLYTRSRPELRIRGVRFSRWFLEPGIPGDSGKADWTREPGVPGDSRNPVLRVTPRSPWWLLKPGITLTRSHPELWVPAVTRNSVFLVSPGTTGSRCHLAQRVPVVTRNSRYPESPRTTVSRSHSGIPEWPATPCSRSRP